MHRRVSYERLTHLLHLLVKELRFSAILAQYQGKHVTGHKNIVLRFSVFCHIIVDISCFWAIMHSDIGDMLCLYEPKEAVSELIFWW